ncbi:hypothetical protein NPIL_277241 [Nephila pilipes]|uniref:Uncharacterized protein n=1 Tax=Nephila pilipes TaxID=299642 RepID=A0A8X6T6C4_NEPPI|nr:hypothetical protein NPIL_277241 [Nephila pilipes]
MIALLPICITLAFLPKLPALCVTKDMRPWINITCVPVDLSTEARNQRDIGRRDNVWGNNLWLSHELFDVIVAFVSFDISFLCLLAAIFVYTPANGNK